jgi:beta-glucanase (GH16 family)
MMMLAAAAATGQQGLPKPPVGYAWELIPELTDEFNGSELDTAKWMPQHAYWEGRQPSRFDPANVSVRGGSLRLKSTTRISNLSEVKDPMKDVWVSAACVTSKAPTCSYGYYEARMKASLLSMTSSFWMQGKYSELDVVEQFGAPLNEPSKNRYMLTTTRYFKGGWNMVRDAKVRWRMPSGAGEKYHVYGIWWKDKGNVSLYHDGDEVAQMTLGGEFLEPMYMFFDTEVFTWEGLPTIQSLKDEKKNTMEVDWVRSWRLKKME